MELKTTENSDSSLGSAMLAGIAAGVFPDAKAAVAACVREKDHVTPNSENTAAYERIFAEYKRIVDALAPIYRER
jgi:ribulose kinase